MDRLVTYGEGNLGGKGALRQRVGVAVGAGTVHLRELEAVVVVGDGEALHEI